MTQERCPGNANFLVTASLRSQVVPSTTMSTFGVRCTKSSRNQRLHVAVRSGITLCGSRFLSHASPFRVRSLTMQAKQVPDDQKDFHYGILYDVFPVGTAGIPPTLLMQDMLHFLPNISWITTTNTGEDDMLIQLGLLSNAPCTVSLAVIQALRTALLYPLDDPNPKHLQNRAFFER